MKIQDNLSVVPTYNPDDFPLPKAYSLKKTVFNTWQRKDTESLKE